MGISGWYHKLTTQKVSIAPLVTFRVLFGLILFVSTVRFWMNGWIESQYIDPILHFKYFGFHWLPEPSPIGYYLIFSLISLSALGIAFGALFRFSAITFFVSFTFIELVDVSYYLNHYYFVSLVALLLIFLPANRKHSLDVKLGWVKSTDRVSAGAINIIKFQLILVYFFAGVAKLNADWLLNAMPLAIWLPAQDHLPIIGGLFQFKATAIAFSWAGALYDLSIPIFLIWKRTRLWAYVAVIVFHLLTWTLFQIGMFPFIMIGATLIFFSADFHERLQGILGSSKPSDDSISASGVGFRWWHAPVGAFIVFQLAFPLRHLVYPGNPFWHEQGYRFGWRVMLMEKAGYAQFQVTDDHGRTIDVQNSDFLTPIQEKMMGTQPDLMLQYAAYLKNHYNTMGVSTEGVYANVYVTFNGRASRPFVDPSVNLASVNDSWKHKNWILPYRS